MERKYHRLPGVALPGDRGKSGESASGRHAAELGEGIQERAGGG